MENHEKLLELKENARFTANIPLTKQYFQGITMLWTKGKCVAFGLILFVSIWILILGIMDANFSMIWIALVYLALGAYLLLGLPAIRAKRSFEINLANYGTVCEIRYLFSDELIISENVTAGGMVSYAYGRIRSLRKTKEAYAFFMEKHLVFYIPFEALQNGAREDFERFMIQKCPTAKNRL